MKLFGMNVTAGESPSHFCSRLKRLKGLSIILKEGWYMQLPFQAVKSFGLAKHAALSAPWPDQKLQYLGGPCKTGPHSREP